MTNMLPFDSMMFIAANEDTTAKSSRAIPGELKKTKKTLAKVEAAEAERLEAEAKQLELNNEIAVIEVKEAAARREGTTKARELGALQQQQQILGRKEKSAEERTAKVTLQLNGYGNAKSKPKASRRKHFLSFHKFEDSNRRRTRVRQSSNPNLTPNP